MNSRLKYFIVVAVLVVLTGVFFHDSLTGSKVFITGDLDGSDIMDQYYPVRKFFAESIRKFSVPLWNPYIYNGFPSYVEGQGALFYPINLLMFTLLPAPAAYNYTVLLNFIMSGLFFFIFARSLKISVWGALAGSIVFMFSGFFITHLKHMSMINAACWIPLLFYSVEMFFREGKIKYAVLAGFVFAMQLLAGHPQIVYYSAIAIILYSVFKLFVPARNRKKGPVSLNVLLKAMVIVVLVAVGLSAVQMIPSSEFLPLSTRSIKMDYTNTIEPWAYAPVDLITMILPYHFGDPATADYHRGSTIFWENCGYAGILPLLLAVFMVIAAFRTNRHVRFFAGFSLLAFVLIMPTTFPLLKLLWHTVPGFSLFRFPQRFLVLIGFSIAVLAGFGFDRVLGLCSGLKQRKVLATAAGIIMTGLIVLDLFRFGMGHNPTVDSKKWFKEPDTAEFIRKDSGLLRTFGLWYNYRGFSSWRAIYGLEKGWKGNAEPFINHRKLIPENSNILYGISSAKGYSPLYLKRFFFLENAIAGKMNFHEKEWVADVSESAAKVLGLCNVKYIPSAWELRCGQLTKVMSTFLHKRMPSIKLFRNEAFMPRAFIVPRAIKINNETQIIETLLNDKFDPKELVILEEDVLHGSKSCKGSEAKIDAYSAREVEISAKLTAEGFLVLTDTYYPGWKAYVDGKEQRILQADYIFRAIPLKKGIHRVKFVFKPVLFRVGALITAFTALILIVMLIRKKL